MRQFDNYLKMLEQNQANQAGPQQNMANPNYAATLNQTQANMFPQQQPSFGQMLGNILQDVAVSTARSGSHPMTRQIGNSFPLVQEAAKHKEAQRLDALEQLNKDTKFQEEQRLNNLKSQMEAAKLEEAHRSHSVHEGFLKEQSALKYGDVNEKKQYNELGKAISKEFGIAARPLVSMGEARRKSYEKKFSDVSEDYKKVEKALASAENILGYAKDEKASKLFGGAKAQVAHNYHNKASYLNTAAWASLKEKEKQILSDLSTNNKNLSLADIKTLSGRAQNQAIQQVIFRNTPGSHLPAKTAVDLLNPLIEEYKEWLSAYKTADDLWQQGFAVDFNVPFIKKINKIQSQPGYKPDPKLEASGITAPQIEQAVAQQAGPAAPSGKDSKAELEKERASIQRYLQQNATRD